MSHDEVKNCMRLLMKKDKNLTPILALLFIGEFCDDVSDGSIIIIGGDISPNIRLNNVQAYYKYRAELFLYLEQCREYDKKLLISYLKEITRK